MGENTNIQWADHSINFWIGCSKVTDACRYCYAEKYADRYFNQELWGVNADRHITSSVWQKPYTWNKQANDLGTTFRVFANSLSDFFEPNEKVEDARNRAWKVIQECDHLDWLILTKRPQHINRFLPSDWGDGYPNVWLGTSVAKMSDLIFARTLVTEVKAKVKWLSMEPLLEPVTVYKYLNPPDPRMWHILDDDLSEYTGYKPTGINWVVVGGESGLKSEVRDFNINWAKEVLQECQDKGVPFFMKQLGARPVYPSQASGKLLRIPLKGTDRQGSDISLLPKELQVREFPKL